MSILKSKWTWLCLLILLAGGGLLGWLERASLAAWYQAGRLARATTAQEREDRLRELAALDHAAIPALLRHLDSSNESARDNMRWALAELVRQWGPDETNTRVLLAHLGEEFAAWNGHGKGQAMHVLQLVLELTRPRQRPTEALRMAARFLAEADPQDSAARAGALELAAATLARTDPPGDVLLHACRKLASASLKDERAECRAQALRLSAAPQVALVDQLPPLLADADPQVRTLALLAVGGNEELVSTDELLPLLHDSSKEVRLICEQALRSRGLGSAQLQLARAMCDPQPGVRARVPAQACDFPELDTKMWLERLSRDSSPAVRAAVVRVAVERGASALRGRLAEMAQSDADQTVRQLADYYLHERRR